VRQRCGRRGGHWQCQSLPGLHAIISECPNSAHSGSAASLKHGFHHRAGSSVTAVHACTRQHDARHHVACWASQRRHNLGLLGKEGCQDNFLKFHDAAGPAGVILYLGALPLKAYLRGVAAATNFLSTSATNFCYRGPRYDSTPCTVPHICRTELSRRQVDNTHWRGGDRVWNGQV